MNVMPKEITAATVMTTEQFARERAEIAERFENPEALAAKLDQALSDLYVRSGWTQRQLAEREGKSQSWVDYRLRFGRFLTTARGQTSDKLTEWRFRTYWERTDQDAEEDERFREVADLMVKYPKKPPLQKKKPAKSRRANVKNTPSTDPDSPIRKAVRKLVQAGKPVNREELAQEFGVSPGTIRNATDREEGFLEGQGSSPSILLSKEEKAEAKAEVRKQFLAEQRESLREKAKAEAAEDKRPRLRQSPSGKPILMFGRQIWPIRPEDYKELGGYDYDQMFFTVHQFTMWHELIALNPKCGPATQAKLMRVRMKSFMKFVDRRLEGRDQKEMKTCFALFQKLADFLEDNPTGECWPPPDLDNVFAGF